MTRTPESLNLRRLLASSLQDAFGELDLALGSGGSFEDSELMKIDPIKLSRPEHVRLLPAALVQAFLMEDKNRAAAFLHPFLWPIHDEETQVAFVILNANQKEIIFRALVFAFEEICDLIDDEYWKRSKKKLVTVLT